LWGEGGGGEGGKKENEREWRFENAGFRDGRKQGRKIGEYLPMWRENIERERITQAEIFRKEPRPSPRESKRLLWWCQKQTLQLQADGVVPG
jgi:hypothetical protein